MKPAAIGATLFLHTATIGAIMHFGSDHGTAGQRIANVELVRSSSALSFSGITPVQNGASLVATPAKLEAAALANRETAQMIAPDEQNTAAQIVSDSPKAGLTAKAAGQEGVSIPASYASSNRKPAYPYLSRRQEEQGTVVLRVLVTHEGRAGEVKVAQSSGYPLLDESALIAVREWRFHPASVNSRPVTEWYQVAIPFKLPN